MTSLFKPLARWYQRRVFNDLAKYGLRYEDMLIENADVHNAHKWAPSEDMAMRGRRIKRAVDLNMKVSRFIWPRK